MPAEVLFDWIGLGTAFVLAGTTYSFFYWLDRNASTEAKQAISSYLRGQVYTPIDVRNGIISAFDRLYSYPLLRLRAFVRSAVWSIFVSSSYICLLMPGHPGLIVGITNLQFWLLLPEYIVSDYLSLFIIRWWLASTAHHPIRSSLLGCLLGVSVVIVILSILDILKYSLFLNDGDIGGTLQEYGRTIYEDPTVEFVALAPGFVVHLWLLLFALGAIGVRLCYPLLRAVESARWFLKEGDQNPLRAVGVVAGALVFVVAGISKLIASIV
jgi:hypothetical protein